MIAKLRALRQRIRHALQRERKDLRVARAGGERERLFGRYFIVTRRGVIEHHVDTEKLARELDLLEPWEIYRP